MSNKGSIPQKDRKILWSRSGGKCAISKMALVREKTDGNQFILGVEAHIEGEKPGSARYNPNMTKKERNCYENLILVSPDCHTIIDNDEEEWTVDKLKRTKREHEEWVENSLLHAIPNTTFAELEVIMKYLATAPIPENYEVYLDLTPIKKKIKRNELSESVEKLITIGLLQVEQVKDYLNKNIDLQFAERLRAGFVNEYNNLSYQGLNGDALFYALRDFASNNSPNFNIIAAGLSVLTYYFELCEVFEK